MQNLPEPDHVNNNTLQRVRNILGESRSKSLARIIFSNYLRWRFRFNKVGNGFHWGYHWKIKPYCVSLGHYVFVGSYAWINYPIVIGDLSMIAPYFKLAGNDHGINTVGSPSWLVDGIDPNEITIINSDVWIGMNVTLIHGVEIGRGAVIATGSVVTKDVDPYSVVGGVPARVIRRRFTDAEIQSHEEIVYVD